MTLVIDDSDTNDSDIDDSDINDSDIDDSDIGDSDIITEPEKYPNYKLYINFEK